ncbi:PA2778 family cysteine peptidase [uncultured Marinobacter sp.]|uniref:PA2778 family cysteine peptidase n=1 Tax=uncultured Marinobacter sp. TaxID=187379 RepID=UPI0026161945|nr:PA2778 family cysteine peptidase [uncultured Marinobacter sp.]
MHASRPQMARFLAAALLGVLLSGCASQPKWPDTYETATLTNVPFYPQELYQCGPASLAMMLNAQNVQATPDELVSKVYLPERKGALQVEMVAAARQYGMLVYPLKPELDVVLKEVEAGHPVLVLQNLRFGWWPQWHFAVVIGYDSKKEVLILHSGTEENYRLPASAFMATWDRSERWARVILPPNQMPASAEPLEFLMAAHDLETTQQTKAAKVAYSAAAQTWPDQPAALLGLGNLAYQQGNWSEAEKHYRAMTEQFPDISAGWNNLAEALSKQGRDRESSAMLNKAQEMKGLSEQTSAD